MIDESREVSQVLVVEFSAALILNVIIHLIASSYNSRHLERLDAMSAIEQVGGFVVLRHENGSLSPDYEHATPRQRRSASVESAYFASTQLEAQVLARLRVLPETDFVSFNSTSFSDQQLKFLNPLKNLRRLQLNGTDITDDGVRYLAKKHCLESLTLNDTEITDESIEALASMESLKKLYLRHTKLSNNAIGFLRMRLPHCNIYD